MLADPPRGYFHEHEGIREPSESSTRRVIQPRTACIRSIRKGAAEHAIEGSSHQEPPGTCGLKSTEKHTLKNTTGYVLYSVTRPRRGGGERDDDIKTWRTWRHVSLPSAVRASAAAHPVRERYFHVDLPRGSSFLFFFSFIFLLSIVPPRERSRAHAHGGFLRDVFLESKYFSFPCEFFIERFFRSLIRSNTLTKMFHRKCFYSHSLSFFYKY